MKIKKYFQGLTLQKKISWAYSCIMAVALLLTLVVTFRVCYTKFSDAVDGSLRNAAIMAANLEEVREMLRRDTPDPQVSRYLDHCLGDMENVDILTICNLDDERLYHVNKEEIGKPFVGGDEGEVLQGRGDYFTVGVGTLGLQRRYFRAVTEEDGTMLGFVAATVLMDTVNATRNRLLLSFGLIAAAAIVVVVLVSLRMNRFLQNLLLGYAPEQLAHMFMQRKEVMDAMEEGIIAIDTKERVIMINESARQLLNLPPGNMEGRHVLEVFPQSGLPKTLREQRAEYNKSVRLNEITLLVTRIPVMEKGRLCGAVSIFQNRTEMTKLAQELTGVNHMVEAMRAYTHEFTNKLHVILGLIQTGNNEEAAHYIMDVTMTQRDKVSMIMQAFQVPIVSALLIGKLSRAGELGITLIIDENSYLKSGVLFLPGDVLVTLIGNLIENSIESLNMVMSGEKKIHVSIFGDENGFLVTVYDTGRGIPEEIVDRIFEQGFSTKGKGRGTGLYLVKSLVESYQGEIQVESEAENGTMITITIPRTGGMDYDTGCDCGR